MNSDEVIELSQKIVVYLEKIEKIYEETKKAQNTPDFFQQVKPFADKIYYTLQDWEEKTTDWIKKESPKYIHTQQIDSTVENVKHVSVQCFYPDTREKRFKGMIQSIRYVLNDILTKKQ
ncbi:YppE family protein [Sutcliffiella deserti]|uniref:YppE family protein n=1 Tax=Sutcliffiella deserti TaxID=2875501 RepID=UPI001CBA8283|nr:YppE family protein [Sutcliffiella deserti]